MRFLNVSKINIMKWICLLLTVGIFCISSTFPVYASATVQGGATGATRTTENQTVINPPGTSDAEELGELNITNDMTVTVRGTNGELNSALRILLTLTMIALAPVLIILLTSFTRIIIVLHFVRNALNTQTAPPNQVIVGLALFLTWFIMNPIFTQINTEALKPLDNGEITQEEAFEKGMEPLREFMYRQTQVKDVNMFLDIAGEEWDGELSDISNAVLVPSFIVSEMRTAFIIGFIIYIPFIVIDMVVASTLMSMGMMMLPPTTISMPFKILLFVLADGWNLVIGNLVKTFY